MVKLQNLPDAGNWGWVKDEDGRYKPFWTSDPISSKACSQLVKCGCGEQNGVFKCTGRCSCKKAKQVCTELCKCKGACKVQKDIQLDDIDDIDDVDDVDDSEGEELQYENTNLEENDVCSDSVGDDPYHILQTYFH